LEFDLKRWSRIKKNSGFGVPTLMQLYKVDLANFSLTIQVVGVETAHL